MICTVMCAAGNYHTKVVEMILKSSSGKALAAIIAAFAVGAGVPTAEAADEAGDLPILAPSDLGTVGSDLGAVGLSSNDMGVTVKSVAGGQMGVIDISGPRDPKTYKFDLGLDENGEIIEVDGFFFININGETVARISDPWAYDAGGREVPTHFETDGKHLIQVVDHKKGMEYPITADPRWNWGNISGHVYFTKEETRKLAGGAAGAAAVGPFWMAVPPPFGPAIALWWEKNSIDVTVTATGAVRAGTCAQLKVGYIGLGSGAIGVQPDTYTEGCA